MLKGGKLIAIAVVVGLGVLLTFLPNKQEVEKSTPEPNNLTEKVEKAVQIITGGGPPMQGIQLLKEVIEEDPNNRLALYHLGNFSIQSGQFDKAIGRFESLLKLDVGNEEAQYLLGYSYKMNGDSLQARKYFQRLAENGNNAELKKLAQEELVK